MRYLQRTLHLVRVGPCEGNPGQGFSVQNWRIESSHKDTSIHGAPELPWWMETYKKLYPKP